MPDKEDYVSPYLRRPPRSYEQYLRDCTRQRCQRHSRDSSQSCLGQSNTQGSDESSRPDVVLGDER